MTARKYSPFPSSRFSQSPRVTPAERRHPSTAGIQQIEDVAGLDALVISRKRELSVAADERLALLFCVVKVAKQGANFCHLEIEGGKFLLALMEHFAVSNLFIEFQVVYELD